MTQLLQITVTPLKCELQVEHARLELNQDFTPSANVKTTSGELQVQSKPTTLQLDSYQARRSLGFNKAEDLIRNAAQKGQENMSKYIRNTVDMGSQMAQIEDGVTIKQIMSQKMLEQPSMYTAFLPSGGMDISWQPGELNVNYQPGTTDYDWQINKNMMNYIPGSVRMNILQYASIDIKYIGGPMYVPPSADPNYKESSVG